jgi:hypothetical protein
MELRQLVREIHWIEWQLRSFEDKYGLPSKDFHRAMGRGSCPSSMMAKARNSPIFSNGMVCTRCG